MTIQLDAAILKALKGAKAEAVTEYEPVRRLSTGSLLLDYMLGGGLPVGRFTTIAGAYSTGKSTVAQLIAAEVIRQGGLVCYIDAEHAFEPTWAKRIGIDETKFALIQPESAEQALDQVRALIRSNVFSLIVWDSIASSPFKIYVDHSASDTVVGGAAKKWNEFYVSATHELARSGTAVLLVNQIREKIGQMYGPSEYEPGGRGHDFYASTKIRTLSPKPIKAGTTQIGIQLRLKTIKNKTAQSGRTADIDLYTDGNFGIDRIAELVKVGKELGVFTNSDGIPLSELKGSPKWHFEDVALAQGEEAVLALLRDSEYIAVLARIFSAVNDALEIPTTGEIHATQDDD